MTDVNYTVRPATLADSPFLWRLSMEPSVRQNSTRSEVFLFSEHDRWYREKLASPLNAMWIMELGEPMGQVRYGKVEQYIESDCRVCLAAPALMSTPAFQMTQEQCCKFRRGTSAEIAIALLPEYRGHGYGKELLVVTEPFAVQRLDVSTLVALVLVGNVASLRLFRSCDYVEVGHEERMGKRHVRFEKSV